MGDLDTVFEDKVIKSTKRKAQQTKYQGNEIQKSKNQFNLVEEVMTVVENNND